jgi:CheY-like chemotaxis protein
MFRFGSMLIIFRRRYCNPEVAGVTHNMRARRLARGAGQLKDGTALQMNGGKRRKTILVVDDYEGMREMTHMALESLGYRVVEASNGEEAVELAQAELPDLILMDLSMPHLDGFGAIHRIRRMLGLRDVPVVAFSAHTAKEVREDALAAGCCEFITKPFDLDELKAVVGRCVGSGVAEECAHN